MSYKIKFKTQEDLKNVIEELNRTGLYIYCANYKRRFIAIEELTKDMMITIEKLGGRILDDQRYEAED